MKHAKTFVKRNMSIRVAGSCKKHFVPLNLMVLTRYAIYLLQAVILAHVLSENLCPSCRPGVRKKCHIVHVFEKVVALCWALGVAATLKHLWCITASPRSRVRMRPRARQARQVTSGDLGGHTRSLIKAKRAKKPSCTHRLAEQRAKRAKRAKRAERAEREQREILHFKKIASFSSYVYSCLLVNYYLLLIIRFRSSLVDPEN